jgi:hypothetical protein
MLSLKCTEIIQVTTSNQHELKRAQQITHLAAGTPNRKLLGLKSLHTTPMLLRRKTPQVAVHKAEHMESSCASLSLEPQLRPKRATLVGGAMLIGCRARAKLVPRLLRMRHVPGSHYTYCRSAICGLAPHGPTSYVCVSCESAWSLHCSAGKSSVDKAQQSAQDECVQRDERVKDDLDAGIRQSGLIDNVICAMSRHGQRPSSMPRPGLHACAK